MSASYALDGSLDDLKDVCEYRASQRELRVINATALMVANDPSVITYNASSNTYSIATEEFTHTVDDPRPICETSRFYGETHIPGNSARTGFLIAPDKIMTAAHAPPGSFTPNHWLIVFRHSKTTSEDPGCTNFDWKNIPASDVYLPAGTVANTYNVPPSGRYDYAVIQLNRSVTDRLPLKIRRSGRARVGDALFSVGYPIRGAEKVDIAGVMAVINAQEKYIDAGITLYPRHIGNDIPYNIHGFGGSSGSPIYNENDDVVESVMSYGTSGTFVFPQMECGYAAQSSFIADSNGPTADIQDQIPRTEILVEPLDYIEHILDINPSVSKFTNSYTVTPASVFGGDVVQIGEITGPNGNSGSAPIVSQNIPPGLYIVPPNGLNFDVTADVGSVTSCGTSDYELHVQDITNGLDNVIRHHFEIGLREYSLEPADGWAVNALGAPYTESKSYTIKNIRPTPTHVVVSQDGTFPHSNLFLVNGGGSDSFDLGPAGSSTDTATVSVTIDASAANSTTIGVTYNGRISFYNQPFNCSAPPQNSYINRYMSFKRGEEIFVSSTEPGRPPAPRQGQLYGDPLRLDVDLSGEDPAACVQDINLYLGLPLSFMSVYQVAPYLQITVTSPAGASRILWSGNDVPNSNYVTSSTFESFFGDMPIQALYLDDQTAPPLGPNLLTSFSGAKVRGHWYVDVSSSSSTAAVVVGPVQLDFTRTAAACLGGL